MKPLSFIETPFSEKFGVPRQSLLIEEAWGLIKFPRDEFYSEAFRGIENFSHLWLIFEFHLINEKNVSALVRPPRFGGKKKFGVFATRSPHRQNRLGLSVVKLERLEINEESINLWVSGVDLVSGTPILDIKPYIPYVDSLEDACAKEFDRPSEFYAVKWDCERPEEWKLIEKVISMDPRPGQDRGGNDEYGVSIAGHNIIFRAQDNVFNILSVSKEIY